MLEAITEMVKGNEGPRRGTVQQSREANANCYVCLHAHVTHCDKGRD
jgi:hypothetical protein